MTRASTSSRTRTSLGEIGGVEPLGERLEDAAQHLGPVPLPPGAARGEPASLPLAAGASSFQIFRDVERALVERFGAGGAGPIRSRSPRSNANSGYKRLASAVISMASSIRAIPSGRPAKANPRADQEEKRPEDRRRRQPFVEGAHEDGNVSRVAIGRYGEAISRGP